MNDEFKKIVLQEDISYLLIALIEHAMKKNISSVMII